MAVTDEDEARAVRVVLADVEATLGPGYESMVRANARRLREFIDDPVRYFEQVVEDTQQDFHDGYIDTSWPTCPLHGGRHPLWLGEGGWWCQNDGVLIAAVGRLGSLVSPRTTQVLLTVLSRTTDPADHLGALSTGQRPDEACLRPSSKS